MVTTPNYELLKNKGVNVKQCIDNRCQTSFEKGRYLLRGSQKRYLQKRGFFLLIKYFL